MGDILSVIQNCSMRELTNTLFNCWKNDKIAYTRIAVGMFERFLTKTLPPKEDLRNVIPQPRSASGRKRPRPGAFPATATEAPRTRHSNSPPQRDRSGDRRLA